jgi:hypothetical protein
VELGTGLKEACTGIKEEQECMELSGEDEGNIPD